MPNASQIDILIAVQAQLADLVKTVAGIAEMGQGLVETTKATAKLREETSGWMQMLKVGLGIDIGHRVIAAIGDIRSELQKAVTDGVKFNATLESTQYAVAGVLKANGGYENFTQAMNASAGVLKTLQATAIQYGLSYEALLETYQGSVNAMVKGGITDINKQIDLAVKLQQAMAAVGVPEYLRHRDTIDLLNGQASRTMGGRALGISDADIKNAREAGQLYEFLSSKIAGFAEGGTQGMNSFNAEMNRFHTELQVVEGELAKPLFDALKGQLAQLNAEMRTPEFKEGFKSFAQSMTTLIENGAKLVVILSQHTAAVVTTIEVVGGLITAFEAVKLSIAAYTYTVGAAGSAMAFVTAPVALFVAALGTVVSVIMLGKSAWDAWRASKDEALSVDRLRDGNLQLAEAIAKVVDQQERDGKISAQVAEQKRKEITDAIALNNAGALSGAYAELSGMSANLITKAPEKPAPAVDKVEILSAEEAKLQNVKEEAALRAALAVNSIEEAQNAASLARREISTQDFYQKRLEIAEKSYNAENDTLLARLDLLDRVAKSEPEPEKQQQMAVEREKLLGEIMAFELKHKADVVKLKDEEAKAVLESEKAADAARVSLATAAGEKLLAAEQKIKDKYDQMRREMSNNPSGPAKGEIDAAEQSELAQARVTAAVDRTTQAEKRYQDSVRDTAALVQAGSLRKIDADKLDQKAAADLLKVLSLTLIALQKIGAEHPELKGVIEDLAKIQAQIHLTQAAIKSESFTGTLRADFRQLSTEWSKLGANMAHWASSTMKNAIDATSSSIAGALMHTKNWGQAWLSMAEEALQALIKIGIQYLMTKLGMMAVDEAATTKSVANSAITTATAVPAGIAKSGEQGGWVGILLYFAAFAAVLGAVMAMSSKAGGSYADGGVITGPGGPRDDKIPIMASNGEAILTARTVGWLGGRSAIDALNNMQMPGSASANLSSSFGSTAASPLSPGFNPNVKVDGHSMVVVNVTSDAQLLEVMKSHAGKKIVVNHVRGTKREIGIHT